MAAPDYTAVSPETIKAAKALGITLPSTPTMPAPTPQVAPNLPPSPTAPSLGNAPRPTTYGTFAPPNPAAVASDPYYQFRLSEGLKQQQRSAAARGTLLTGGFQKALQGYSQGLASEEAGKTFDRSLAAYDTNRATNAQNFGQQMGSYEGSLGGYDRQYRAGRDTYGDAREAAYNQAATVNANASGLDDYRRYVAEQPMLPPPNPFTRQRVNIGTLRTPYTPTAPTFGSLSGM